ncbi:hypothetical protein E2C01_018528 [Portunus trituberculatus]|uniref:Uncharacterized protein n=1 Tax=Portunus trituberculatus TaxID=210409 RepID=A0A5B7DWE2_PORTR|nr:hypothetical protein [Portunus trituberculatus]
MMQGKLGRCTGTRRNGFQFVTSVLNIGKHVASPPHQSVNTDHVLRLCVELQATLLFQTGHLSHLPECGILQEENLSKYKRTRDHRGEQQEVVCHCKTNSRRAAAGYRKRYLVGKFLPYNGDAGVVQNVPQSLEGLRHVFHGQQGHEVAGVALGQHQRGQHPQPQHQTFPPPPLRGPHRVCVGSEHDYCSLRARKYERRMTATGKMAQYGPQASPCCRKTRKGLKVLADKLSWHSVLCVLFGMQEENN